jgi:DNA-directed RNA polymerase III subunit RPC3
LTCVDKQEEASVKAVLTKRELTDVAQDASLLTRMEREVLAEWEGKREMLDVLDEAVFILRDLDVSGGTDNALMCRTLAIEEIRGVR